MFDADISLIQSMQAERPDFPWATSDIRAQEVVDRSHRRDSAMFVIG